MCFRSRSGDRDKSWRSEGISPERCARAHIWPRVSSSLRWRELHLRPLAWIQIAGRPRCARNSFTLYRAFPLSASRASRIRRTSRASSRTRLESIETAGLTYRLAFFFVGDFRIANVRGFLMAADLVLALSFFLARWWSVGMAAVQDAPNRNLSAPHVK